MVGFGAAWASRGRPDRRGGSGLHGNERAGDDGEKKESIQYLTKTMTDDDRGDA